MEKDVWSIAIKNLKPGQHIRNWTPLHGYMGNDIIIAYVNPDCIQISAPNPKKKEPTYAILYKHEIDNFSEIWKIAKEGKINRAEYAHGNILGNSTRRKTRYCLDIFKELSNRNLI